MDASLLPENMEPWQKKVQFIPALCRTCRNQEAAFPIWPQCTEGLTPKSPAAELSLLRETVQKTWRSWRNLAKILRDALIAEERSILSWGWHVAWPSMDEWKLTRQGMPEAWPFPLERGELHMKNG